MPSKHLAHSVIEYLLGSVVTSLKCRDRSGTKVAFNLRHKPKILLPCMLGTLCMRYSRGFSSQGTKQFRQYTKLHLGQVKRIATSELGFSVA